MDGSPDKEKRIEELNINAKLVAVVTHQEKVIAELKAKLGEDSSNSHRPPSTDGLKARAERRKRARKKALKQ